jgi:hypothetical protein
MLTLKTIPTAPELVTVHLPEGAKLFLRPWGSGVRLGAIRSYWSSVNATNDQSIGDVGYAIGAVRAGLAGWEGFDTDAAPDQAAEFSPELLDAIELLMVENFEVYSAIHAQYVAPALARESEKNGSSLPHAGGSPAEAKRAANRSSSVGAAATSAPSAKRPAKNARSRTGSTGPKPAS